MPESRNGEGECSECDGVGHKWSHEGLEFICEHCDGSGDAPSARCPDCAARNFIAPGKVWHEPGCPRSAPSAGRVTGDGTGTGPVTDEGALVAPGLVSAYEIIKRCDSPDGFCGEMPDDLRDDIERWLRAYRPQPGVALPMDQGEADWLHDVLDDEATEDRERGENSAFGHDYHGTADALLERLKQITAEANELRAEAPSSTKENLS